MPPRFLSRFFACAREERWGKRVLLAMTGCVLVAGSAFAAGNETKPEAGEVPGLRFSSREAKVTVEPGIQVVDLNYEFTNTTDMPVAVESFLQSCGCMSGEWDGKPVDPGAKGIIKAKLVTTGLRGKVRKSLHVKFLELGTVELTGEVTIPDAITYSAQTLRWTQGEASTPKHVDIEVHSVKPIKILSVSNTDPAFATRLETIKEGRSYRVIVTPRDTTSDKVGVFQVRTDAADSRDALQGLFAVIEKPAMTSDPEGKGGRP